MMTWFYALLLTPLFIWMVAWLCFRILFIWLSKKLRKKLNLGLSISKIHPTYLEGISIAKEGLVSVNIDHIQFSSKWINSQCNKPFTLYVGPFTVNILKTFERNQSPRAKTNDSKKDNVLVSAIAANTIKFFLKNIGVVLQDLSVTATIFDTVINWTSEVNVQFLKDIHNITFEASFMNCNLTAIHNELPLVYMSHNLSVRMCIPPGKPINGMSHIWRVTNLQLDLTEDLTLHVISLREELKNEQYNQEMMNPQEDVFQENSEEINKNKLHSLLNSLPQGLKVSLENFKIVYRLHSKRELQMDWNCVLSWQRSQPDKHEAILDILGFVINGTDHCKLLLFKQMMIKLDVYTDESANRIQLFNKMDTCHIDYIYKEILFWKTHFSIFHGNGDSMNRSHHHMSMKSKSSLLTNTVITADNMLENCSCDLYINREKALTTSVASIYLGKLELCVSEARLEEKRCSCTINLTDMYSYIDAEEILPTDYCALPCQLEHDQPAVQPSSERHAWGRVFEIGKISLNCDIQPGYIDCKCEVIFVAFEWSLAMGHSILHLLKDMHVDKDQTRKKNGVRNEERQSMKVDIDTSISNVNMFIIGEKEGGFSSLICKMDKVSIVKGVFMNVPFIKAEVQGIIISQLKELSQMKTGDAFYCRKSNLFDKCLLLLPLFTANMKTLENQKVTNIEVKYINVDWNPNVHMAINEHICNLESFLASSKDIRKKISSPSHAKPSSNGSAKYTINIPNMCVKMDTIEEHSFSLKSKTIEASLDGDETLLRSHEITLYFDDVDIFRFINVEVKNVPKNVLSSLRNQLNISDTSNRTWSIGLHSLDITFPYQFNFAKSLEHFQLIIKLLKFLHKKAKNEDYMEPLPPDLQISCQIIRVIFDDDPFEVQLGSNYMLLCDEMEQANEREQVLEEKLDQIKSEIRTMLPGKQIEALREKLKVKNSQIYIDRSKEMCEDHSLRKTLFLVEVKGIKMIVLVDSSLHGRNNILRHMETVNPESPIPEDIQFSTLWCRMTHGEFQSLKMLIRDYPQPLMQVEKFSSKGLIIGAEACGIDTATQEGKICVGYPWEDVTVTRNMQPLKYYYDLKWDMSSFQMAYGVNAEPAVAMINQSFELISKPSVDPSVPMPFWDKIRLLLHGNLKMDAAELIILMIASTDPHNMTEKLEIEWSAATVEWTNGKISIDGNYFDMTTHTASKYDDSKVCHFPNFKMVFELQWVCEGDSNDHHDVYPTHPKYVKVENHDSYANFRSTNLNMSLALETCMDQTKESVQMDPPYIFLYASTFRWFQHYQSTVINRVSRPIKRGNYFSNVKPRKPTVGRHLKLLEIDLTFPSLNVTYWGSYEKEMGFEATIGEGSLSVAYQVFISPHPDGINLIRRPIANWIIRGLSSVMENVRVSVLQSSDTKLEADDGEDETLCIEDEGAEKKHYLFSVDKLEYKRLSIIIEDSYTHKILLQNFRGAWTAINRELTFTLLEAYSKMQRLKKVLLSEALKLTSDKTSEKNCETNRCSSCSSPFLDKQKVLDLTKSPMTSLQSGYGVSLLQQLVLESKSKFMIQLDEEKADTSDAAPDDEDDQDVLQRNWHIELVNSQVLLHGTETKGAIIVTSGNATILKRLHHPVNVNADVINKMNKVTWRGKFRNLQCFSTMENFKDITVDNIPWLTTHIISESGEDGAHIDPQDITLTYTKSSNIVGGFVEVPIGDVTHQLQRVIARTECEFRFLNLDFELDPAAEEFIPKPSEEHSSSDSGANTVDLKLGKLEMSTSNSQYSVVVDICQNLIFHTEQKKKEGQEKLEKMKFKLHLNTSNKDMKNNVSQLQTRVRDTQMMLRHYEREFYNYKKKLEVERGQTGESDMVVEIEETMSSLQEKIEETKQELFEDVEELKILIRAYKDVHNTLNNVPLRQKGVSHTRKKVDVHSDDLQWSLTKDDGHLTMAHAHIKRFRYNQLNYEDNSTEHCFEVGNFALKNLLPNETYQEALMPHEVDIRRLLDKMVTLRIYCRISPAVAGIMVKDHFEVNVCPIKVQMSHKLFHQMESFFFPRKEESHENTEQQEFKLGMLAAEGAQQENSKEESEADISKSETASINLPPQRPPQPSINRAGTFRRQKSQRDSITSVPEYDTVSLTSTPKMRKPANLSMHSVNDASSSSSVPVVSPLSPSSQLNRNSSFRRSNVSLNSMKDSTLSAVVDPDRDVNTMKERAAKNQTFIYVKIPEVPVCFSYKGEKERNIEDAHNFNLCLPTLEYHSRTWTWQDLFQALKKDYIQVLVPQILKEKLHLKSAGPDTKPSIAKDNDANKAKLLLGENQHGAPKKSAKKLFGKFLKHGKPSVPENVNEPSTSTSSVDESKELSGKGVVPTNLEDDFKRLRDLGGDNEKLI